MGSRFLIFVFLLVCVGLITDSPLGLSTLGYAKVKSSVVLAQKSKKKRNRKKRKKSSSKSKSSTSKKSKFALSIQSGYEANYGTGVVGHWYPIKWLDLNAGVGYTLSGARVGVGSDLVFGLAKKMDLNAGFVLGFGSGTTGKATITGNVEEEGTGNKVEVKASRLYELSSYIYVSPKVSMSFKLSSFTLTGGLNYVAVLSGNEVEFTGPIEYDSVVEATNTEEADEEFKKVASEEVAGGGVGFTVGMLFEL